ncbi:MAG: tetratricopeptide repeat protein, partial [Opitutaceae bacterium]|nr:tetratricopeptide repeat protein [Opitutaceae bacterium]
GAQAFAAGDFPQAAEAFGRVEADFGGEPDWRSGALPRRLLPLRGFASLRAGRADAAADDLAAFLEQYPGDAGQRGFARFALALACEQAGRWTDALGHFETFETEHPGTAQATLARLRRAEILFADARPDEALSLLTAMADDPGVAESFRTQARLRACEWAVELGRDALAADLLLGAPWNVATMPEIGVLAFAALETGDRMLAAGRADDAVRAYRLVPPKRQLVAAQRERLGDFERLIAERAPAAIGSGLFWTDYYRARLDRVRAQLATLEAAEDYSWPLRLRQGQAMLLAGRGREAWLCFETVATTSEATEEVRRDGHYRWILAAAELARWDDALVIARDYVERFPESTLAAEAFHLIARAHLERQDFTSAEAVLGDIVTRFPDSSTAVRARFTRGWVRTMREDYPAARDDFAGCVAAEPSGPLAAQAGLWIGLTHHFAREFEQALAAFDALVAAHPRDPQLPEILYRRGATLYAMRDFVRAREAMSGFVSTYRMHARHPEALVLLGDILMGSGDLAEARRHFAEVPVEATDSFVYAAFQIGKILRAQARYADMAEHFSSYVRRAGSSPLPRVSEALYHLGWAEEQRGHAAAALPVYAEALARFGDDPAAAEVGTTLNALQRLSRRLQRTETTDAAIDPAMHRLVGGDFAGWLHEERERARAAARATWHARLTLALADVHLSRREPTQAEVLLLELVGSAPLEALDAAGLARVGMTLQSIGSEEAEAYFHRLLAAYPRCPERAVAYVGLATSSARGRRPADALAWIARFDRETPGHPLAPQAGLLAGEVLEQTGRHDEAAKRYDSVLRLKAARGRAHAQALTGLARCARAGGDPSRAIAYFQRVYTLHRAQGDLAAIAYLESAPLFEALGDAAAAAATYREMLGLAGVGDEVQRAHARRALATLEQRLSTTSTPDAS